MLLLLREYLPKNRGEEARSTDRDLLQSEQVIVSLKIFPVFHFTRIVYQNACAKGFGLLVLVFNL